MYNMCILQRTARWAGARRREAVHVGQEIVDLIRELAHVLSLTIRYPQVLMNLLTIDIVTNKIYVRLLVVVVVVVDLIRELAHVLAGQVFMIIINLAITSLV